MSEGKIRLSGLADDSIVDGPGLRLAVFTQGCPHGCPGCHNPHTHSFTGGYELTAGEIIEKIKRNPLLDGITLTGGEPMCQAKSLLPVAEYAKENGLGVMIYSGYTFEEILTDSEKRRLLELADILVDGRFEFEKRNLSLKFRGSSNQRVIDLEKSFAEGVAVTMEF